MIVKLQTERGKVYEVSCVRGNAPDNLGKSYKIFSESSTAKYLYSIHINNTDLYGSIALDELAHIIDPKSDDRVEILGNSIEFRYEIPALKEVRDCTLVMYEIGHKNKMVRWNGNNVS